MQSRHAVELNRSAVETSLQSLPLEAREIVVARIWGKLSFQQIGKLIGASSSTAHRRYESALKQIRDSLSITSPNSNREETQICPND